MRTSALRVIALLMLPGFVSAASFTPLGDLPGAGFSSVARGVSDDGAVVVGYANGTLGSEAFRWKNGSGMVGLGNLSGDDHPESGALAVSSDGAVVVGFSVLGWPSSYAEAFRWTSGDGMVGLGDLPGASVYSVAYDVSADGSVVVGQGSSPSGGAVRWTSGGGMQNLGDLPGAPVGNSPGSLAFAVSADGAVVVGYGYNDDDGAVDANDNCTLVENSTQLDADHDGYGNICDADLNNSGLVTAQDNTILRNQINTAPGPSGYACAGTIPCP